MAFDAKGGHVLWDGDAGGSIGVVVPFRSGDKQRTAVAASMNSPMWPVARSTAEVVVFGL
jgi:hypothetical protein